MRRRITTDAGILELIPVPMDQLRGIARYWPMELLEDPRAPGSFGLVFQRGGEEVHGIKMQPPDIDEETATTIHFASRALIASALPYYLERQHRGVMVPCAYYKAKASGTAEAGFAFFVGPDAASMPSSEDHAEVLHDEVLGKGATRMVFDMALAIKRASKERGLPMMPVIGIDLRPRLMMGGLGMDFAVEGPRVFVIKDPLREDDPLWEYVVRAGFTELPYAPMKPAALPGSAPTLPPRT